MREMLAYIRFMRKNEWSMILRRNLDILFLQIESGDVDALDPATILVDEAILLKNKGYALVPDVDVKGKKILKIVKD